MEIAKFVKYLPVKIWFIFLRVIFPLSLINNNKEKKYFRSKNNCNINYKREKT